MVPTPWARTSDATAKSNEAENSTLAKRFIRNLDRPRTRYRRPTLNAPPLGRVNRLQEKCREKIFGKREYLHRDRCSGSAPSGTGARLGKRTSTQRLIPTLRDRSRGARLLPRLLRETSCAATEEGDRRQPGK